MGKRTMKHLQRDLDYLKREILAMGYLVEEAIGNSCEALIERQIDLAREVIEGDSRIDQKEIEVEEECLKVLALHQPVAADLRFIVAVLKVNNDLERMGDLAKNIAKRAIVLARSKGGAVPQEMRGMAERVRAIVARGLDSLVRLDPDLARAVCRDDDIIDEMHKKMFRSLQKRMREEPGDVKNSVCLLSISRYLERIADLATNISEDVVFTVEGEVIRHGGREDSDPDAENVLPMPGLRAVEGGGGTGPAEGDAK